MAAVRALVLGGNGFIGRHIARSLVLSTTASACSTESASRTASASTLTVPQKNWSVSIGTRHPEMAPEPGLAHFERIGVRMEQLSSASLWLQKIQGFDVVINAVGILRERGDERYEQVHHLGPKALAQACKEANIPLIHISALGLENPVRSRFLTSKLRGEQALLNSGARVCIVRPSLLDGEAGFGSRWVRRVGGWPVQLYPGNALGKIACCRVTELAEAIANLAASILTNKVPIILEMSGEQSETIADHLARRHTALRGYRPLQIPVPGFLARAAAHVFDLFHISPFSFGHYELLRFDNCPERNALVDWLGRPPADVLYGTDCFPAVSKFRAETLG